MGCQEFEGGVICSGPRNVVRRHIARCWNCETDRRIVQVYGGAWYPSTFYCCHCGDGWGDGERLERPFARGWRQKSIRRAKQYWREALTPDAFLDCVRADLAPYVTPVEDVVSDL